MIKNKYNIFSIVAILLTCLVGCSDNNVPAHIQQGFTQRVIYDLGEARYTANNRDTHELTFNYKPGSLLLNLSEMSNKYELVYEGYELIGWYEDAEFTKEINFQTYELPEIAGDEIRIYARWDAIVKKYFTIHYVTTEGVKLEQTFDLVWDENKPFNYSSDEIPNPYTEVHTYIDAYKDAKLTQKVDETYLLTHDNINLPIYTKWIEGDFAIVNNANDFIRSINGKNLYLNSDIDLTGKKYTAPSNLVGKIILGNNYTISNLELTTTDTRTELNKDAYRGGLVNNKIENCIIKDLTILNAKYVVGTEIAKYFYFGALASNIVNSTIENVNISGELSYSDKTKTALEKGNVELRMKLTEAGYNVENSTITNCIFNIVNKEEMGE